MMKRGICLMIAVLLAAICAAGAGAESGGELWGMSRDDVIAMMGPAENERNGMTEDVLILTYTGEPLGKYTDTDFEVYFLNGAMFSFQYKILGEQAPEAYLYLLEAMTYSYGAPEQDTDVFIRWAEKQFTGVHREYFPEAEPGFRQMFENSRMVIQTWTAEGGTQVMLLYSSMPGDEGTLLCFIEPDENAERMSVLLDGEELPDPVVAPEAGDGLRVIVTVDSETVANLPFGEEHTLQVIQSRGLNTLRITADAVYMESADCDGQDCVNMGRITRDNLETRVMGGFIICLPHRVSVEVREE